MVSLVEQKDAFICHCGADKDWARELGGRIEAETIDGRPNARRMSVFFDEWDIDGGENFVLRLGVALKESRFLIAILSPEFFKSGWASFEWTDVVAADPARTSAKLLPIVRRVVSLDGNDRIAYPAPFKAMHRYDFTDPRRFKSELEKVIGRLREEKPKRGLSFAPMFSVTTQVGRNIQAAQPDITKELLVSNMIEVLDLPPRVYFAPTEYDEGEIRAEVPHAVPFLSKANKIWTFADLSSENELLRAVVDCGKIQDEATAGWMPEVNPTRAAWLVELLNKCITSHLSKLAIKKDKTGRFFFRPKDGADRIWGGKREVAAMKTNESSEQSFWVHHSATVKLRRLGSKYFIVIEPSYVFTSDGNELLEGDSMGRLSIMWGGRQKNPDILRNVAFWVGAMSRGLREFPIATGGPAIKVSGVPATGQINVGIEDDHIRIGSLLSAKDAQLEEAAQDVELVEESSDE